MFQPVSDAQMQCVAKYRNKFDRMEIMLPKGHRKIVKEHAKKYQKQEGEPGKAGYSPQGSVTAFVARAIYEAMERDKEGDKEATTSTKPEITNERILEEAVKAGILTPRKQKKQT